MLVISIECKWITNKIKLWNAIKILNHDENIFSGNRMDKGKFTRMNIDKSFQAFEPMNISIWADQTTKAIYFKLKCSRKKNWRSFVRYTTKMKQKMEIQYISLVMQLLLQLLILFIDFKHYASVMLFPNLTSIRSWFRYLLWSASVTWYFWLICYIFILLFNILDWLHMQHIIQVSIEFIDRLLHTHTCSFLNSS